jgi:Flp pilus assembly protein TadB
MLILLTAVSLFAAIVLFTLSFGSDNIRNSFRIDPQFKQGINKRVEIRLKKAGYLETQPGFFYMVNAIFIGGVMLILFILTKAIWLPLVSIPFVMAISWFWLNYKERSYLKKAGAEMPAFLSRVLTSVGSGSSPQNAFLESMDKTKLMREALQEEMRDLALNEPMSQVLRRSVDKFPLRTWEQFVRHLIMQIERGGDIEGVLESSVAQIQGLIELQAELTADSAEARREQLLIIFMAVAALFGMNLVMGGIFFNIFSSFIGWIGFFLGFGMIVLGIWFGQKTVRDIEERLDF